MNTQAKPTFKEALVQAIVNAANAPLTEADRNILFFHLDHAITEANQILSGEKQV